ncbi:TetR/AcrR family transcriptional regulator (plasmid) [Rhodococcus globerulus]|uniref:TetR/AcrR family transcriptional regulator n=1 Tax=Rhodococcus globerulus TaxID=33008 RepID=UPI0039EB7EA5
MVTRAESAATTRRALLAAAATLLHQGGPEAVTLREVGAMAGVSRGAPYGHFTDKENLLTAVAIEQWNRMTEQLSALQADSGLTTKDRLRSALIGTIDVARNYPHLYALMFTTPSHDPELLIEAASGSQDIFLAIVAQLVGDDAARRYGALLMSTAHGIADMERSGQLNESKWGTTGDDLVDMLIGLLEK